MSRNCKSSGVLTSGVGYRGADPVSIKAFRIETFMCSFVNSPPSFKPANVVVMTFSLDGLGNANLMGSPLLPTWRYILMCSSGVCIRGRSYSSLFAIYEKCYRAFKFSNILEREREGDGERDRNIY